MTNVEFLKLSEALRNMARTVPLKWGAVQNDRTDDNLVTFEIPTIEELERRIAPFRESDKAYHRRRWFLWKCSECDEYLFYKNQNVEKNPDRYDKRWDIRIDGKYEFDVKGTVIPKEMRDRTDFLIRNPKALVDFYYDKQSTGRRYDVQNRLFIVHHSFISEDREVYLRSAWGSKERIFKLFCENVRNIDFIRTHGVSTGIIFILERQRGIVDYVISGYRG